MDDAATRRLIAALPAGRTVDDGAFAQVDAALQRAIERARAAWPDVSCPILAFAEHVGARLDAQQDVVEALDRIDAAGLWIACACLTCGGKALVAFEHSHRALVQRVFASAATTSGGVEDLAQTLRTRLFLGSPGAEPTIARYRGDGPLAAWLRVVATRLRIDAERKRTEAPLDESRGGEITGLAADPELSFLAAHCRDALAEAIRAAFGELTPRQRNLLRLHLLRDTPIAAIAELHAVSLSSAKRWVADARAELVRRSEAALRVRLGADTRELDSVLRVVQSRLHVSLRALLESTRADLES